MDRREFCEKALTGGALFPFVHPDTLISKRNGEQGYQYKSLMPRDSDMKHAAVPEDLRLAFDWEYFSLSSDNEGVVFDALDLPTGRQARAYLRLQVAIDTRQEDEVEVYLDRSGRKIGQLSIWYPMGLQLFETPLDCTIDELRTEGIRLRLIGGSYDAFYYASHAGHGSHLLIVNTGMDYDRQGEEWPERLCSDYSLQPFSWAEGVTLDGLQELYLRRNDQQALRTIESHLDHFLVDDENLIYVDLWARPRDNTFVNLETGLPFATILRHRPSHPAVPLFRDYCLARFDDGMNLKYDSLSTEGCYTLAYPLAVLGVVTSSPELCEMAVAELQARVHYLTDEQAVYNTGSITKGKTRIRRNWGRGYAWFLLGIARTVETLETEGTLKNDPRLARLKEVYQYYAHLALSFQQVDKSWNAYLDQPETYFESTATAGLASAFAHGYRLGWLPDFSKDDLRQIYERLLQSTTPDGYMKNVSQHNAGSINLLQRGTYRVIAQYALGFFGHIRAHL